MKIERYKEIELTQKETDKLFKEKLEEMTDGYYLNTAGEVEHWTDTGHGSGYTEAIPSPSPVLLAALQLQYALSVERKRKNADK